MHIPLTGREYANWNVSGAPEGAEFEVILSYPDGTDSAWLSVETVSQAHIRKLFCGPDASVGGAFELPAGTTTAVLRLTDNPEIVVRPGGEIDVS